MKPTDPEELKKTIQAFETFWLSVARLPRADTEKQ